MQKDDFKYDYLNPQHWGWTYLKEFRIYARVYNTTKGYCIEYRRPNETIPFKRKFIDTFGD